jgi:hypothetical protein
MFSTGNPTLAVWRWQEKRKNRAVFPDERGKLASEPAREDARPASFGEIKSVFIRVYRASAI